MRPCQQCGTALSNHQKVCPECGAEQVKTVGTHKPADDEIDEHQQNLLTDHDDNVVSAALLSLVPLIPLVLFPGIGWLVLGAVGFKYGLAIGIALFAASLAIGI